MRNWPYVYNLASTKEQMKTMSMLSAEPPAWADLYNHPEMVKEFPYLPTLKEGLLAAKPRPITPYYQEVTSAIEEEAYVALQGQKAPTRRSTTSPGSSTTSPPRAAGAPL